MTTGTIDPRDPVFLELCRRDPMFFRNHLILDGPNGTELWENFMADFQIKDFKAIDPAIRNVTKQPDAPDFVKWRKFYIQRSRGSSKTTDFGSTILWMLIFSKIPLDMIMVAEDRDQALFIRKQIEEIVGMNPWITEHVDVQSKAVVGKRTRAKIESMSSDRNSSFGITPHVTFADEWSHWSKEGFWGSIYSSFAKREDKGGLLFLGLNAGAGRDWKYVSRENFRNDPSWYFSAPEGSAPWYTEATLKSQRLGLSSIEFDRLWLNIWQESAGGYVTLREADACINPKLRMKDGYEQDGWAYVAAVDYAEKHDRTVGTVLHRFADKLIVDRMDVIDPHAYGVDSIRLDWVEQWMRDVNDQFGGTEGSVEFVVDKWQMLSIIQRLRDEGFWVEEFDFKSGAGNYEIGLILRQLIIHNKIEWYEGCGQILKPDGTRYIEEERDDLGTELAALEKKDLAGGSRWRFDHGPSGHDDRAFALGAAVRHIVVNSGGLEDWNITPPDPRGGFRIGGM